MGFINPGSLIIVGEGRRHGTPNLSRGSLKSFPSWPSWPSRNSGIRGTVHQFVDSGQSLFLKKTYKTYMTYAKNIHLTHAWYELQILSAASALAQDHPNLPWHKMCGAPWCHHSLHYMSLSPLSSSFLQLLCHPPEKLNLSNLQKSVSWVIDNYN